MAAPLVDEFIPEWGPFRDAICARRPEQGTACAAWTVRDVAAHNAGNAQELARILSAYLEGHEVPETRSFEEREAWLRALTDDQLLEALDDEMRGLTDVLDVARAVDGDELVPWTGRQMKVAWFGEHMREELILHRWDVVGDDAVSEEALSQPWLTAHSVFAVGRPLLAKGRARLGSDRVVARLRAEGTDDVLVDAGPNAMSVTVVAPEGPATIETDAAARVLLLWGRQPADPGRLWSDAGPEALGATRTLLSGY